MHFFTENAAGTPTDPADGARSVCVPPKGTFERGNASLRGPLSKESLCPSPETETNLLAADHWRWRCICVFEHSKCPSRLDGGRASGRRVASLTLLSATTSSPGPPDGVFFIRLEAEMQKLCTMKCVCCTRRKRGRRHAQRTKHSVGFDASGLPEFVGAYVEWNAAFHHQTFGPPAGTRLCFGLTFKRKLGNAMSALEHPVGRTNTPGALHARLR